MAAKPDQNSPAFQVVISPDRMEVSLRTLRAVKEVKPDDLLEVLKSEHIAITKSVEEEIAKLAKHEEGLKPKELYVIGHGIPPVHAIGPKIEQTLIVQSEGEGRDRTSIPSVTEGMTIGKVIPGSPGKDGVDVQGKPIPFHEAPSEVSLGNNVSIAEDGVSIVANRPGLLQLKRGKLGVETAMEVPGNLDYSVGNVNFAGSVLIRGNVADLFKIVAKEDVYVGGAVEAADLQGGHNVEVHGGICCRDKGHILAGNDLRAKYISNTTIEAGNDVTVHSEIANSRIMCKGHLSVTSGPIYASHVTATGGITASSLGSVSHAKTLIECGVDTILRKTAAEKLPEIQASLKRVAKVREVIEPLLAHQKNLTPSQKEKATEMLYEANQLQQEADETMKEILADYQRFVTTSSGAEVLVSGIIHPGVTIRFPEMETTIRMPIKGPVRIVCRNVRGMRSIFAVDESTKVTHQLELRGVHDEVMAQLAKTLNEGKQMHESDVTKPHSATPAAAAA